MQIIPARLKMLREEQKRWTCAELAKRAQLSERTVQRLESESEPGRNTRESNVRKLAAALEVSEDVLTGALPLPDEKRSAESAKRDLFRQRFSVEVSTAARNAYELIKIQYGVQPTTLVEMAPLFFVLLAEASLADRRRKLEQLKSAIASLEEVAQGHLVFAYPAQVDNGLIDEAQSIAQKDLFGSKITEDVYNFGYSDERDNPFVSFLRKLAETLNDPYQVLVSDTENIHAEDLPDYSVCMELVRQLTCDDSKLGTAIAAGFVQLSDMPTRLRGDEAAEERLQWLRERHATWQAEVDAETKNLPPLWEWLGIPPEFVARKKEKNDDSRHSN